jgi:cytochrome c553
MKLLVVVAAVLFSALVVFSPSQNLAQVSAQEGKKLPEIITLGTDAKLGTIKFSHLDHTTKNRSIEGSKIACIECHHVAQPAAEAGKHPPLKTAWPADRTTTLTAELFEKDPVAAGVAVCRDCHARSGMTPKLLAEIPQIKLEVGTELITLVNQQAFHRNCAGCHDEIVKTSKDLNPPGSKKCTACHKRAAA